MTHGAHDSNPHRAGRGTWAKRLFTALILGLIFVVLVVVPMLG